MNGLPGNIETIYALTPMQKALLFHSLATPPESAIYFQQLTWTIRNNLDAELFREAWTRVAHRHAVLRTFFVWEGRDEPLQCVCKRVRIPWQNQDWRDRICPSGHGLAEYLAADRANPFLLNEAPLLRFHLLQFGQAQFQFVWSFHHILMDGWCLSSLVTEAFAIYHHLGRGAPLRLEEPPPYSDFVGWLLQQNHAHAREMWRQKLRGFYAPIALRIEALPGMTNGAAKQAEPEGTCLSESITSQLRSATKRHRCTLATLIQAAWAILLRSYSGEPDVVFGVTIAGRPASLPRVDRMIGLFINTLPARVRLRSSDHLSALLRDLMAQQIQRDELSYSSLAEVQSVSEVPGGKPLFDSIIVFENYPIDATLSSTDGPLAIHDFQFFERTGYPLTLLVVPGREMRLKLSYDGARFQYDAIIRLQRHLASLLENIASKPDGRICDYQLLPQEELVLLRKMNQTEVDCEAAKSVHELIEAQSDLTPDAVALIVPSTPAPTQTAAESAQEIAYSELNRQANQLAHFLRRLGVNPDEPVGIYLDRSVQLVIALLAILKSGAAYVPLDPSYPAERVQFMLNDARPRVVLTESSFVTGLDESRYEVVALDDPSAGFHAEPASNPRIPIAPEQLAYIIYTSGSTGQPKGAMNTHGGVSNRLRWMQQAYQLQPDDRVLQKTPFSFDVSVWEFFWPLMTGAQLILAKPGGHQDPDYIIEIIQKWSVTTVHFVPSLLRQFLNRPGVENCTSLRRVICSGEALPADLESKFVERFEAQLYNLYGPTEAAVDVTAWHCRPGTTEGIVPIGRPIANTETYVLDPELHQVPIGAPGELCIGGLNVGRGYWNRPSLTAEKFVPDPFSNRMGARLYKTGDLARQRADGVLEYLDRIDHQVKIRGFRVELGEIEGWLSRAPGVNEVAVVVCGNTPADKRLVAYVVCPQEPQPTSSDLHRFLRQHLPDFMVPSSFVFLQGLPLSPNGKLDRRALPPPDSSRPRLADEFVMPRSEAERKIARVWCEVLGVDKVGIHDNFFELGGNSLLLFPVLRRLERLFERPIPLLTIYRSPTVKLLAERLIAEPEALDQKTGAGGLPRHHGRSGSIANTARQRQARLQHRASNSNAS